MSNENLKVPEEETIKLSKYKGNLIARPGKYTVFGYEFETNESSPFVGQPMFTAFSVLAQVREQI